MRPSIGYFVKRRRHHFRELNIIIGHACLSAEDHFRRGAGSLRYIFSHPFDIGPNLVANFFIKCADGSANSCFFGNDVLSNASFKYSGLHYHGSLRKIGLPANHRL